MSTSERKAVVKALERNLKKKTAENYEKQIYRMCKRMIEETETSVEDSDSVDEISAYVSMGRSSIEALYPKIAYEKVGQLILCEDREGREEILADIKDNVNGFDTQPYKVFRQKQKDDCSFTAQGPKVEEGEFPCRNPKCKSKRCYFYQIQTRSLDEGATTFVTCVKCKFRYNFN